MQLDARSSKDEFRRRERTVGEIVTLIGLLMLLAVAALAGGVMMMTDPTGTALGIDTTLLAEVPWVSDYLVPGVLLTVLLGVVPLVVTGGLLWRFPLPGVAAVERRLGYQWPLLASVTQGFGVVVWIGLQLLWLPETATIQWVTLTIVVLIMGFSLLPAVRDRYRVRCR
ncbi:MAG: hypothetical protein ACFCVC_16500 [Acidimicrobiia bacterium]